MQVIEYNWLFHIITYGSPNHLQVLFHVCDIEMEGRSGMDHYIERGLGLYSFIKSTLYSDVFNDGKV